VNNNYDQNVLPDCNILSYTIKNVHFLLASNSLF